MNHLSTRLLMAATITALVAAVMPVVAPTPASAVTNVSGIVNTYQAVASISADVVAVTGTTAGSATPFANGDTVMLIQMTGAPPTQAGSTTGVYELRQITNVAGNNITLDGITRTYDTAERVQLIRVPDDSSGVTVTGSVLALPWDGTTGGVIALTGSTLTMTADIVATGTGFTNTDAPTSATFSTLGFGGGIEGLGYDGASGSGSFVPGFGGGGDTGGGGAGGDVPPSGGGDGGGPGQGGEVFGVTPIAGGVDGADGAGAGAFGGGTGAGGGGGIIGGGGGGAGLGGGAGGGTDGGGGGGALDSSNVGGSGGGGAGGVGNGGDGVVGAANFPGSGGNEGSPGGGGGSYGGGGGSGAATSGGDDGGGGGGGGSYNGGGAGGVNGWPTYGDGGRGNDAVADPIPSSAHYLHSGDPRLLMGAAGGLGSSEAGNTLSGAGGGIIFLDFDSIDAQTNAIRSDGAAGLSPAGGGAHSASGAGGAGQMHLVATSFTSLVTISAVGGIGGTPTADSWHAGVSGGGGGGGGVWIQTAGAATQTGATATVSNVSFDVSGGPAGPSITNPQDGQLTATSGAGGVGLVSVSGVDYDLALTKHLSVGQPEPITAGSDVIFSLVVYNQGDASADAFSLVDHFPDGAWSLSGSNPAPWSDNGDGTATLSVTGAGLTAGGTYLVDIVLTSPAGAATGVHTNWAEIAVDDGDDLDSIPDVINGGLSESPLDDITDGSGGDEDDHDFAGVIMGGTTGAIEVTKTIGVGDASATTFEYTLSSGNCTLPVDPYVLTTLGGGTAVFGGLEAEVSPGVDCSYTVAETNLPAAWYPTTTNPVAALTVSAGAVTAIGFANSTFDLALVVTTVTTGPAATGTNVTFGLQVVNQGGVDAFDVIVTDYLPALTSYAGSNAASVTSTANAAPVALTDDLDGTMTIDALGSGDSVSFELTLLIDSAFGGTTLTNWAEISDARLTPAGVSAVDIDSTANNTNFSEPGETNDLDDDDVTAESGKSGGDEDDHDPSYISVAQPSLLVRKYVQNAYTDPGFDPGDDGSLGDDAQTPGTATGIPLGADAVYRITVANTGALHFANVVVDDAIAACTPLTRIDAGDNDVDELLAPTETWTYECALPDVLADVNNTATAQGTPVDPLFPATPLGPDVTDDDPAYIVTQPLSLGNEVFLDDDGDGARSAGEAGIPGVVIQVWADDNSDGSPDDVSLDLTVDAADIIALTTTDAAGEWLVSGLPEGKYLAIVPSTEWAPGQPLENLHSSIGVTGPDVDNVDNGLDVTTLGDAVSTSTVTLIGTTEPIGETPDNDLVTPDDLENLTIDFGFTESVTVGNRVWLDSDNNGALDVGEVGIPGVTVEIWADSDNNGVPDLATSTATDTTDADGYYLVTALSPGTYLVSIPASEFLAGGALAGRASSTGNSPSPDPDTDIDSDDSGLDPGSLGGTVWSRSVTLSAGLEPTSEADVPDGSHHIPFDANSNVTVDFGFYVLGGIGDAVFYDDNGNGVHDGAETFVAGVGVDLLDGTGALIASTVTDGTGRYTFGNLPAGSYEIHFVLETLPAGFIATTANAGTDDAVDSDGDPTSGRTGAIVLGAGQWLPDWDLGIRDADADIVAQMSVVETSAGVLVWSVTVTNNGPDAAPGMITVVDTLPGELTHVSNLVINTTAAFACNAVGQVVTCIDPDGMAAGHVSTIEISTSTAAASGTVISNSVTASAPGTETFVLNNTDNASLTVGAAATTTTTSGAGTTTTTSGGATTSTTSGGGTTTVPPSSGTSPDSSETLPATGSDLTRTLVVIAAALMICGAMLAQVAEQRRVFEAGLLWVDEAKRPRE